MRRRTPTDSQPREHMPLTPVEFHILLSLSDGARHGYAILQDVTQRTGDQLRVRTGTLYTVIKRMLDGGWIEETDGRAHGDDDERRRYYRLTPLGRDVTRVEARRLEALVAIAHEKRVLPRRRALPETAR
jgi:DNA-binding PadR family transcriptional regulator